MALSTLAKGFVTPGISNSFGGAQLTKGWIGLDKARNVPFQYNPATIKLTLQNRIQQAGTPGGKTASHNQGPQGRKYNFDLIFDTFEDGGNVWDKYVSKLAVLFEHDPNTVQPDATKQGTPPTCTFFFGKDWSRKGFLTSMVVNYSMFHSDLTPARAKVTVDFVEADDPANKPMQNPTSGGIGGDRSYTVQPGDTLEGIAFREFGNPTQWRAIADANGMENPRDLKAGRRLAIPLL